MRPSVWWRGTRSCCARLNKRARARLTGMSARRRMTGNRKKAEPKQASAPDIVVITGLSGSGMSSATNAFEDLGYFCVDNLPLTLLPTFARLVQPNEDGRERIERAALVINIREGEFLVEFDQELERLRERGLRVFILFL